ncbi:hypothetical protein F4777DRAFT_551498 [Nemania sp. FL0916]|nr:hypothetical protein F4777DRAFT_551498 [Nemania sp. FL0916]
MREIESEVFRLAALRKQTDSSIDDTMSVTSSDASDDDHHPRTPPVAEVSPPEDHRVFQFNVDAPPSLLQLAKWLGLKDAPSAAMVMNSSPIQKTFAEYRSPQVCKFPQRLSNTVPLMTYERADFLNWKETANPLRTQGNWGFDLNAALFAHKVVRFLESDNCEDVKWEPIAGQTDSFEKYEIFKRRWALVLQMFWFLEKTFVGINIH